MARTFKVEVKDENGWSGYVVMKHLTYDKKWDLVEEFGEFTELKGKEQMKAIRGLIKNCEENFLEVKLSGESGTVVSNLAEMKEVPELHGLIMNLAMRVFNGNLGNVK